jgi:curved DNA-binding protein CbpA
VNYYEVLDVGKNPTAEELKVAKRRAAKKYHPDRDGGSTQMMVLANKAYDTLSDPHKKEYYDLHDEDEPAQPPFDTQALQILYNMILQLADQVDDNFDFVDALNENLRNNLKTLEAKPVQARRTLVKTEKQRTRIRRKKKADAADNLLARVFDQKIAALKEQLEAGIPQGIALAKRALEILADYEYAGEKKSPMQKGSAFEEIMRLTLRNQGYK